MASSGDAARAREDAGSEAVSPAHIPVRGWGEVLRRVWWEAIGDQIGMAAAACGFYAMFALFPAISILISVYGLVVSPNTVTTQLEAVQYYLPTAAYEMIGNRIRDLAAAPPQALTWNLILSTLVALWGATAGMRAMIMALNVAYEEREKRSLLRFHLTALLFTLGGIVGVCIALTAIVGVPALIKMEWLGPLGNLVVSLVSFLLLLMLITLWLALVYRYGPSRREARWRWVSPGSLLAAVLWMAASALFSFYVSNFGSYDATYGSLGAVVIVLLWFYISSYVVLLGAELNAELELQTARDTTAGSAKPMGRRGAFVADHVATAP